MERKIVNIAKFLDREGKIIQIPARTKTQMPVLQYAACQLEPEKSYTQPEINAALAQWHTFSHSDTLRRYLVEQGFLDRTNDGRAYWVRGAGIEELYWTWKRKEY